MDQDSSSSNNKKILFIEDEHFISELYTRALAKSGYDVKTSVDGREGLELALSNNYDIILLDIMIPNVTGTEILKKIKDPNNPEPIKSKVIITTNLEQGLDSREEIEKQADGYVIKAEATPKQLVEFVKQLS